MPPLMTASEEVKEFLKKSKVCSKGKELTPDRCREILLTTDGLGKTEKERVLTEYVGKLQRQKFLLETRLQQYIEDRRKWLDGEDNAVLREEISKLKDQLKQKDIQVQKLKENVTTVYPKRVKVTACFYCDKVMESPTVDHFIPVGKGGQNWKINKVGACSKCNGLKGSNLPTPDQIRKFLLLWDHLGVDWKKYIQEM